MPINCDINIRLDAGFWLLLSLILITSFIGWENRPRMKNKHF